MERKVTILAVFLLMMSTTLIALGQGTPKPLFDSSGTTVVPEIFLRGYDPITVFFSENTGPKGGGPMDEPGDLLQINPDHPGEYRWLDKKLNATENVPYADPDGMG